MTPMITIDRIVTVAGSDVFVRGGAQAAGPERLWKALEVAWSLSDPYLEDAWHGGSGPYADTVEMTYEEYLEVRKTLPPYRE